MPGLGQESIKREAPHLFCRWASVEKGDTKGWHHTLGLRVSDQDKPSVSWAWGQARLGRTELPAKTGLPRS